jgi:CHAT domain-containing protein
MDALYARLPDLRVWRGLAAAPGPNDTLAAIPPSTVLLEFIVDDDDVLALIAEPGGEPRVAAKLTTLKRRVLAERVNSLLRPAVLHDSAAWRMAASRILELLPPEAPARLSAAARIIIVPHDILWRVPFEALPVGDGSLGERTQVSYAGSRTALLRSREGESTGVRSLVAVSAPALVRALAERILQVAPDWSLRPAKAGSRETQAVREIYSDDAVVLTGEGATEAAIRDQLESASVLHIAAPFRINGASPLFSPVLLAGQSAPQTPDDDGTLDAREVANLTLAARVAVLSDGSATSMRDGAAAAEIVQWAWLAAGVPSVLLARWTSDPESSDALLVEFHRRVRAGTAPAEALLGARDAVRARPQWAAPYHWAGWMLLGS